jgi:Zn-dependent M28 family amino/carboxypeptidase
MIRSAFLAVALACCTLSYAADFPVPPAQSEQVIRPEAIRAHMQFLSDDLLEGRGTGTRGFQLAANYVRSQFEAIGLRPGGDNGTYFQTISFREIKFLPERSSLSFTHNGAARTLTYHQDYISAGNAIDADARLEAPVVFVGYGVTAPEMRYDDYRGVDVKGKIVAYLYGAPPSFATSNRAHYSASWLKSKNAAAHGAVGVLAIWAGGAEQRTSFQRYAGFFDHPSLRWIDERGTPNDTQPSLRASAALSRAAATQLFEGAPKTFEQALADAIAGKSVSFPLPATVSIHLVSEFSSLRSPNIAGILPGSDPELKNQYVVYTAHADHLGIGIPMNGDPIYNGALDNASGTAALIEMARAFASLKPAPRRSIMFVAVTGEEEGLLGSDYFAEHPTVPLDSIAANLNMDELPMLYDFADIVVQGGEHSTLGDVVDEIAHRQGIQVSPDPLPDEVFFVRSDQYSLVRRGVPAVAIEGGDKAVEPNIDGGKLTRAWIDAVYHTPQDDMKQPYDFNAAVKYTRLNFALGYAVANQDQRPEWKPGDFFGLTFSKPHATK